jgi:geranylgeranyl reductase family protein
LKQRHDVIIVGAGPAGATLAYELVGRGIGVLILEKEKLPRYKCCAGGVTIKAAKLLDFDISEVAEDVIHELSFTFNMSGSYLWQHSQPLMFTVMRDVFDYFLVQKARQMGAALMDGQKVRQVQVKNDGVEISTVDSTFQSRLVVGADGAYSIVARELGMGRSVEYSTGIESEIVVPEEELAKWKSRVQIDLGCIAGGYAWVFPKRNHLSIGAGCFGSRARDLYAQHQKFISSLSIGKYKITKSSSYLIATCTKRGLVWQNKALLLGDAAGLTDPLTGEGIYNAIQSARLAAPVIEDYLVRNKGGLEDYQEIVEEKIMSELSIALRLSKLVFRFPHLAFGIFKRSDRLWKVVCNWMLGEIDYADIKGKAGGYRGIYNLLFRA